METTPITRIIEAALLAAQRPLSLPQLAELFADEPSVSKETLAQAIESLQAACVERGVELVEVASGFRYQVRSDVQPWVSRLWMERQVKYTRATLETLALIAWRQPVTRGEIEQVRGVAVNTNTIKMLEEREWIRVVGHRDVPGKPALYGTTRNFLDYFGLKSLDQLPPLAEIGEIPDLDPELPFEAAPTVAIIEMEAQVETGDTIDIDAADATDPSVALVRHPREGGVPVPAALARHPREGGDPVPAADEDETTLGSRLRGNDGFADISVLSPESSGAHPTDHPSQAQPATHPDTHPSARDAAHETNHD